ncbi:MAG: peptidoglycan DD-metalloendopeptidase family protein [bacterium]
MLRLVFYFTLLLLVTVCRADDDRDKVVKQKGELQQIKSELDRGRAVLDSLKKQELSVQNRITEYDERLASNAVVVNRLGDQLRQVRDRIAAAGEALAANQDHYDRSQRRFLGNLRQFYFSARQPYKPFSERAEEELTMQRQIIYLAALSNFESGTVADASVLLAKSEAELKDYTGESRKVGALKKEKETAAALDRSRKDREQKELSKLYREKTEKVDQVLMLEQAEIEMKKIIARLEQQQQRPTVITDSSGRVSVFAHLKGQLSAPCLGDIAETFGQKVDSITKLRSFSPGIVMACCRGCDVFSVAPGEVAYIGRLRGVGEFVIIDHGGNYFTTYAGIEAIEVTTGRMVPAGGKLARVGADGILRFELRAGREPLDPVDWIRLDGL